ncbi:MAG: hypothetical protein SFH39_01215 [Candidatus Magnetobacterium sp. LHC-1]|uniref:DUF3795 domain-containing protein n=1 Tax=Candidatus Magnetobacterium casense TaxID=1455061 RepID=A0ABS6S1E1_9BACT|nr:hypothetical protein [Candidatus Magnetobacterium casensis]MBF0608469.1 hypothetical protein [Nitrospirota bacterium]MBV6342218.1 hypothetical protein [Candidatus Magnetobacterium casensis]
MSKCIVCNSRKGKRSCPLSGALICSQCCGAKKGAEADCPSDCSFLSTSIRYFSDKQAFSEAKNFEREMKSIIGNEDDYINILEIIESAIVRLYKANNRIVDKDVQTALEYLFEMGKARILGISSESSTTLPPVVWDLIDSINDTIKYRTSFGVRDGVMGILKGIYRVLVSVKNHYNPKNNKSYLDFIINYVR